MSPTLGGLVTAWSISFGNPAQLVRVPVPYLATLQGRCGTNSPVVHPFTLPSLATGGDYEVAVTRRLTQAECPEAAMRIYVAGSAGEWPVGPGESSTALSSTSVTGNIEKGVGFFGAVYSRTVPWETCVFVPIPDPHPATR